jgi:hypothetical protein
LLIKQLFDYLPVNFFDPPTHSAGVANVFSFFVPAKPIPVSGLRTALTGWFLFGL